MREGKKRKKEIEGKGKRNWVREREEKEREMEGEKEREMRQRDKVREKGRYRVRERDAKIWENNTQSLQQCLNPILFLEGLLGSKIFDNYALIRHSLIFWTCPTHHRCFRNFF